MSDINIEVLDGYHPFNANPPSNAGSRPSRVASNSLAGASYPRKRSDRLSQGDVTDTESLARQVHTENLLNVKPFTMLLMFTSLSFFLYFDRGVFSATLDNVKEDFHMKNLRAGICSSAYLVAYCLSSPIFAQIAKYWKPLRLCSIGMIVWVAAVVFSGLSVDFVTLLLARALTGIGEASFLVMAAPFIDFFAPPAKRSTWLACYYSAIPLGYAGGAAIGSQIVASNVFGSKTWRSVYFLEGMCVLPCVVLFSRIRGPNSMLEISADHDKAPVISSNPIGGNNDKPSASKAFVADVVTLTQNKLYVFIVLGYAMQTFFIGAVAIYAIEYLQKEFKLSKGTAGTVFGGMTAVTGLGGSAIGGAILDYLKPKSQNASIAKCEVAAHKLMVTCAVLAAPAAMGAFLMKNLGGFLPLLLLGELCAFMMTGPINSAVVWCVPIPLQPTACAMCNLTIHMLGDALSPIIIGGLSDKIGLKTSLFIAASFLIFSALLFMVGLAISKRMDSVGVVGLVAAMDAHVDTDDHQQQQIGSTSSNKNQSVSGHATTGDYYKQIGGPNNTNANNNDSVRRKGSVLSGSKKASLLSGGVGGKSNTNILMEDVTPMGANPASLTSSSILP